MTTDDPREGQWPLSDAVGEGIPDRPVAAAAKVGNQEAPSLTERIKSDFTYHPPKDGQPERYEALRAYAKRYAQLIAETTPAGREQSLALTNLEQAVFWANAAIARNE